VNIQIGPKKRHMYYIELPYFDLNNFGLSPARPDKSRPTPPHGGHHHPPIAPPKPRPRPRPRPRPPAPAPKPPGPHPHPQPPSGGDPDPPDRPRRPRKPRHPHHRFYPKPRHYKKHRQTVQDIDLSWAFKPLGVWETLRKESGIGNQVSGGKTTDPTDHRAHTKGKGHRARTKGHRAQTEHRAQSNGHRAQTEHRAHTKGHRAQTTDHRARAASSATSSIEHRASSIEHRASSIEHRASSIEHPASSIQYPSHNRRSNVTGIHAVIVRYTDNKRR
jgi:hypothetical protein